MRFACDLHMHSCLSPCGSNDMTPNNMCNMAALLGYNCIALTDHNTARNCPAHEKVCREIGLLFIPGMELCTSEEAHCVCLFPTTEAALAFNDYIDEHMDKFPNDREAMGEQLIMDENDEVIGEIEHTLLVASEVSIDDVFTLAAQYGGIAYPAHIDRSSYSALSTLGVFPDWAGFTAAEVSLRGDVDALRAQIPLLSSLHIMRASDSHYLDRMPDPFFHLELEQASAKCLIDTLRAPCC